MIDAVDDPTATAIMAQLESIDGMRVVQLRALGGAIARVPAEATAYAHRSARVMVNVAAFYTDDRPHRLAWVEATMAALDQGVSGAYVDFLGDEPERVREAYPGATWDRLTAIKARLDPDNVFRRNQNIAPAG